MFQSGIKISKSKLTMGGGFLRGSTRLYSSACLHCKEAVRPRNDLKLVLPKRDYSSAASRPRKSHPIRNTLVLLSLTTGAVVGYAKFDSEFRKLIEETSPNFNEFIKVVTAEEKSFEDTYKDVSNYLTAFYSGLVGDSSQPEPVKPIKSLPEKPSIQPKAAAQRPESTFGSAEVKAPVVAAPPPPPPTAKPPVKDKSTSGSVRNFDDEIRNSAAAALSALRDATSAVRSYGEDVGKLLDEQVDSRDSRLWSDVKNKTGAKEKLVSAAERAVANATETLSSIRSSLESKNVSQAEKDRVLRILSVATDQVESARRELEAQKQRASVTDRYWTRVEEARRYFQEELQSLFPHASISDKKLELDSKDLDLFLLHVFRHVLFYQQELARIESLSEQRARQALERSDQPVSEELVQTRIRQAIEKERRKLEEDLQRKLLIARSEQEKAAHLQLKRQFEAAQDHLKDVMQVRDEDMERKIKRSVDERASSEKATYEKNVATMLCQLKALEKVLDERVEADKKAHQAHVLFSACQSLFRALRSGIPGTHWSQELRPLDREISAVSSSVGGSDPLVSTVLAAIPSQARSRGVYPETALRERFLRVEQVARRVALVPEEGGSLFRYLLSYIQSALLFSSPSAIPSKELKDEVVDISKLNTYDVLQRARYWVDRGDLTMTLRYMNLLRGAPKAVASEWIDEAKIYLETQLIVNTLMAHAAANGMVYV